VCFVLQRKGAKGKKGSGRRDHDKLAKQELRMIKNRESAARSRMRRQQHTAQLEQENEELKGQVARLQEQVCARHTVLAWCLPCAGACSAPQNTGQALACA
jgi:hypothetical protein